MKNNNVIVAEGGELIIENEFGDNVIVPKRDRNRVRSMIDRGEYAKIDNIVSKYPKYADYAEDGTVYPTDAYGKPINLIKNPYLTNIDTQIPFDLDNKQIIGSTENMSNFEDRLNKAKALNQLSDKDKINRYYSDRFDKKTESSIDYTIKSGDTLSKIAKRNNTTVDRLVADNDIKNPNLIMPKQNLVIKKKGDGERYMIADRKNGIISVYDSGSHVVDFPIIFGENLSDAQTVTKYVDRNKDGKITEADKNKKGNYDVDWSAGNKSTGAGTYTISSFHYDPKYKSSTFNMLNEAGQEVGTAIHNLPNWRKKFYKTITPDDNNKSHGCLNCEEQTLKDLNQQYNIGKGTKIYILPEEEGNRYIVKNDKLMFVTDDEGKYKEYIDEEGNVQKGQGINVTRSNNFTKTKIKDYQQQLINKGYLNSTADGVWGDKTQEAYDKARKEGFDPVVNQIESNLKPISMVLDKDKFSEIAYKDYDFNDDEEYSEHVIPYIESLQKNKSKVMAVTGIDSDTYNMIAKSSFGVFGTESNWGDTHSAAGNLIRYMNKGARYVLNEMGVDAGESSSPDFLSKANTYGVKGDYNSIGPTQIRWGQLLDDEKTLLKKLGISKKEDFLDIEKAALATTALLASRYLNRTTNAERNKVEDYKSFIDILFQEENKTWNARPNYKSRVIKNSAMLDVYEQN